LVPVSTVISVLMFPPVVVCFVIASHRVARMRAR
jgi:hypothetical protein